MPEKVKCADCGFLAARRLSSRELVEAEDVFRDSGRAPHAYGEYTILDVPLCFNGTFPLPFLIRTEASKFDVPQDQTPHPEHVLTVLTLERTCPDFETWRRGSSLKEHREMRDRNSFEERSRRWEQEDREWRERVDQRAMEWRQKDLDRADKKEKIDRGYRRWELALVVLAALFTAAAVLGAAFIRFLLPAETPPLP